MTRRRRLTRVCLAVLAGCLLAVSAAAIDPLEDFEDPKMQARYETLTSELRCLVCQNQTIADSNAELAQDLRRQTRDMLAAGATDREIKTFMTERYGDFVLYKPPLKATTILLWAAPVLLLILGLFVTLRVVLGRAGEAAAEGHERTQGEQA
jgi:cytochrome c-type biogenesis protein CcmH